MKFYKNGVAMVSSEHPLRLTDNRLAVDKQLATLNTYKITKGHNKLMTPTVEFCIQRLWQDEARRQEKITSLQHQKKIREQKEIDDIVEKTTSAIGSYRNSLGASQSHAPRNFKVFYQEQLKFKTKVDTNIQQRRQEEERKIEM